MGCSDGKHLRQWDNRVRAGYPPGMMRLGRGLGLVGAVAFIGGGLWVATIGAGADSATSPTAATPTTAAPAVIFASPATVIAETTASPESITTGSAPATPTPPPPLPAVKPRALPRSSAFTVVDLSRLVRLPSGKSFSDCVTSGPDGEPWPSAVHDYWVVGTADWVIETHLGDVGIIYDEDRASFRVRNIEKAGC